MHERQVCFRQELAYGECGCQKRQAGTVRRGRTGSDSRRFAPIIGGYLRVYIGPESGVWEPFREAILWTG